MWWLFHTTALLWKIRYPFHARSYQTSHKIKYIHISCVMAGLLIPFLPIVTSMAKFAVDLKTDAPLQQRNVTFLSGGLGYQQIRFPPVLCAGRDSGAVYYTSILPINLIVLAGLTELILLFWTVHRVCVTFSTIEPCTALNYFPWVFFPWKRIVGQVWPWLYHIYGELELVNMQKWVWLLSLHTVWPYHFQTACYSPVFSAVFRCLYAQGFQEK